MPPLEEYMEEIAPLFETKWLTNMGEKHKVLEELVKDYLNVPHASLTVNGHMALENIIKALNLQGEIITTPFTFISTTHAIVRCGCTPVFCDINPYDYTIDVEKIESLITPKTVAIMPVHVYGNICDVDRIEKIAKKHDLVVIYDAAHAFGEMYYDKSVAGFGTASIFSFHATKVFNTVEGGCISFSDEALIQVLKDIKNFGFNGEENVCYIGGNAKMNEFSAAMGICNLRHIDDEIAKRKKVYHYYKEILEGIEGIHIWKEQKYVKHNYAYFPVVFEAEFGKDRDQVLLELKKHNIYARKYFYPITTDFQCYEGQFNHYCLDTARDISSKVLTLPMYADLEKNDVERICDIVLKK